MNKFPAQVSVIMGTDGAILMMFFFAGLIAAWWALAAFKWDKLFNQPTSTQVQMIRFFLSLCGALLAVVVAIFLLGAMQLLHALGG